jgi:hypothetical protein
VQQCDSAKLNGGACGVAQLTGWPMMNFSPNSHPKTMVTNLHDALGSAANA